MPLDVTLLKKYINPVFIETGSWIGNGIQAALDAGFFHVYSVDIEPGEYGHCVERFGSDRRVTLACEDSAAFLARILPGIRGSATVFLDAHCVPRGSPLLRELDALVAHKWWVDALLIDDMRMVRGRNDWARTLVFDEVLDRVRAMGFAVSWEMGPETGVAEDILVGRRPT